jgi:hypothetical protein
MSMLLTVRKKDVNFQTVTYDIRRRAAPADDRSASVWGLCAILVGLTRTPNPIKIWLSAHVISGLQDGDMEMPGVSSIEHEDDLASAEGGLGKWVDVLKRLVSREQPAKIWWARISLPTDLITSKRTQMKAGGL